MKRLILLRHAKAVAKDAARDFDRVLAPEGQREMERVARELPTVDLALVSPAARARETWERAGQPDAPARFDRTIYEAAPDGLLGLVQEADAAADTVALVGHNPGIAELAMRLLAPGQGPIERYPTSAFAELAFDAASWRDVADGTGRLLRFVAPPR